jgi:hypothetical protein
VGFVSFNLSSLSLFCTPHPCIIFFLQITTGDIICYQKSLPQNWRIYSSVASFLQHVCDHKEEEWKRHILEEEIAVLKRQADTDRLQKDESMTGISAEQSFFLVLN